VAAIGHLLAGGRWTKWVFFSPKALKERTYLREQVLVDGRPANTPNRLKLVSKHLDLTFAFEDLERAWSDHAAFQLVESSEFVWPVSGAHRRSRRSLGVRPSVS
jgi:hypothetical protein